MSTDDVSDIIPSSQPSCDLIKPINRETVHKICSGQVVLSLAIAVKELVENAIDAGATIINIDLKEYGSEYIQVSDNGSGVKEEFFQALTLKHFTSKIQQFDDLSTLSTLGFRGEALSSLCALSDLTITTKHNLAENATKIKYDRNGKIISRELAARERGTTVQMEKLFSTLPVRRKEFLKNLKREFNKMCQLLNAYCLVSKGIKFSCSNSTKGSKTTVVSTDGLNSIKEIIINVFGSKQISSLIEVEIARPDEAILKEYNATLDAETDLPFSFEFLISSVIHGNGRSTSDRQFYFINNRPCEPTKIMKLVNEIYKQYNSNQYPFVFLNIISKSSLVDVNVTPDKRQVFLEKEKVLFAIIKGSLTEAFKCFPSSYKVENADLSQSTLNSFVESKNRGLKRHMTEGGLKKGSIMERFKKRSKTENDKNTLSPKISFNLNKNSDDEDDSKTLNTFVQVASQVCENEAEKIINKNGLNFESEEEKVEESDVSVKMLDRFIVLASKACENKSEDTQKNDEIDKKENIKNSHKEEETEKPVYDDETEKPVYNDETEKTSKEKETSIVCNKVIKENIITIPESSKESDIIITPDKSKASENSQDEDVKFELDTSVRDQSTYNCINLEISLEDIKKSVEKKKHSDEAESIKVRFRSKINPESNKAAEEELRKQISKQDFAKMEIIGQFNLGFIVTRLGNDLFIIDQHATDEKYNFEQLQANTVMDNQVLVNPKPLQLTAGNESLLIENIEIFKKNGFNFNIDESAPCTKKVALTSVPLSKNVIFGKDDIDEMLFILQDSNQTMCRPSRIRAMFASRACRSSVMIGKCLSKNDMRRLVDHMGEIEQPWNCPHGRPTMRHLVNLDLIGLDDET